MLDLRVFIFSRRNPLLAEAFAKRRGEFLIYYESLSQRKGVGL